MKAMILGTAAILVAASAQAHRPEDLKAIGQGRGVYLRNCAACHGADARGAGPRASECARAVPDLTAIASRDGGFRSLHVQAEIRHSAGGGMPSWERVLASPGFVRGEAAATRDVWLLTRYLEYAQTPGVTVASKPEVDPPAQGKPQGR
jgi:mono/diheme cytochrome c family protein